MAHVYALGAVKPWVRQAAQEVGDKFDIGTIYGVGARPDATSDHPRGLATDFMVYKDKAKGDEVAAYVKANWSRLGVKYVIWYQRIDEGKGWQGMEDRGGTTANHKDHVHVSYTDSGTASNYAGMSADSSTQDTSSSSDGSYDLSPLTSRTTWIRVLMFAAGLALLGYVFWSVINRALA
jgi:hypothetical protein